MALFSSLFVYFLYFPRQNFLYESDNGINWWRKAAENYLLVIGTLVFLGVNYTITLAHLKKKTKVPIKAPVAPKSLKKAQIEKLPNLDRPVQKKGIKIKVDKLSTTPG
jgi:hypothetical protein